MEWKFTLIMNRVRGAVPRFWLGSLPLVLMGLISFMFTGSLLSAVLFSGMVAAAWLLNRLLATISPARYGWLGIVSLLVLLQIPMPVIGLFLLLQMVKRWPDVVLDFSKAATWLLMHGDKERYLAWKAAQAEMEEAENQKALMEREQAEASFRSSPEAVAFSVEAVQDWSVERPRRRG